ncbi:MAG: delta-60 repeat domain-containing protein [Pirellulaceae bacterium]
MVVQPDGKVLVGVYNGGSNNLAGDYALIRYNADGSLDTTFGGGDGVVKLDPSFGLGNDGLGEIALQSDGKIVVSGYIRNGSFYALGLSRFNSDGTIDTTFGGGDGVVVTPVGSSDYGFQMEIQSDGKLVVAGRLNNNFGVVRYDSNGVLDRHYGMVAWATSPPTGLAAPTTRGMWLSNRMERLSWPDMGWLVARINSVWCGTTAMARWTRPSVHPERRLRISVVATTMRTG